MSLLEKYLKFKHTINEQSENFKNWFGKSILHDKGTPHTFYHGTSSDITKFSHDHTGKGNDTYGSGFYFTNKPDVAGHYTSSEGGNILPVHLKVTKPIKTNDDRPFTRTHITKMIANAPEHKESLKNFGDVSHEGYHKVLSGAVDAYEDIPKHQAIHSLSHDFYGNNHQKFLDNLTKHTGHDAVIDDSGNRHKIVNVFHPHQIKSAIGNSGAYTKDSNNITEENI